MTGYNPVEQDRRAAAGLPYATGADDPDTAHDHPGAQPETRPAT
jgi:hypothetical protein